MEFSAEIFWSALLSQDFLNGAILSIQLAVVSQLAAMMIGLLVAVARISKNKLLSRLGWVYVWFFRAVPTLLVLLIIWNAGPQMFPVLREEWFSPFLAGFIGLTVVEGAYMAEILRSALLSLDDGQALAARALGMRPVQVFFRIALPQAFKVALGPTGNEFIAMIKYTALASVISLRELLTTAQVHVSSTFRYAEYYAAALIYYLVIVSLVMALQYWVERRLRWTSRGINTAGPGTDSAALPVTSGTAPAAPVNKG